MRRHRDRNAYLRAIPSVHSLLQHEEGQTLVRAYGHEWTARVLAEVQQEEREKLRTALATEIPKMDMPSAASLLSRAKARLDALFRPRIRRVINATGVVLHTNLGRAPLPKAAIRAVVETAEGYSNLEYDLDQGTRGSRHAHLERLLIPLTGAEAGMAVNNNAAAVLLVLSALAAGREVIVSRGELVEIGGSFRIPDVMAQSGAKLVEVGTTNRTRASDYRQAVGPETAALLKVHRSNYRMIGFVEEPELGELVDIGREFGIPVLYDVGSGVLVDLEAFGLVGEPTVADAIAEGASLVTFSGDKLLGGPQAGLIVGEKKWVEACARHPLARAVRIDKMTAAALEQTLLLYLHRERALEEIPTLRMLKMDAKDLLPRAQRLEAVLRAELKERAAVGMEEARSQPGGGSFPGEDLPSPAVTLIPFVMSTSTLATALRAEDPPVVGRIEGEAIRLDLRTVFPEEEDALIRSILSAFAKHSNHPA